MNSFVSIPEVGELYMGEVITWYDGPRLFSLTKKDSHDVLFLAYWIGDYKKDDKSFESYMIIPASNKRVDDYNSGLIDFFDLLNIPNEKNIYRLDDYYSVEDVRLEHMTQESVNKIELPKKGMFVKD